MKWIVWMKRGINFCASECAGGQQAGVEVGHVLLEDQPGALAAVLGGRGEPLSQGREVGGSSS